MATITRTVYVTAYNFSHMKPDEVHWAISESKHPAGTRAVMGQWPHEITLPLPEDFNPHAAQVAALEAEKAAALAAYQASVAQINERLSKLLALEA